MNNTTDVGPVQALLFLIVISVCLRMSGEKEMTGQMYGEEKGDRE